MKKLLLFISYLLVCCICAANDCGTAIPLTVGTECTYNKYSTSTGKGKACASDCGWADMKYREVWFTANMPSTGRLAIATQGSYIDGFMSIYRGSCGNLIPYRCSSNGRLPEILEVPDLPAGEQIYIRVAIVSDAQVGICVYQLENIEKPKCSVAAAAADYCGNATLIQSPDGYCGNTSSQYSVDAPGNLQNVFCGSIENNSWLQFVAAESEASLNIFVNNCRRGIGIQMRIYGTDDCIHFNPYSNCWNPAIETNGVLTARNLTPGKRYYLMIDGYAGDVCDYTISGGKGVEMPQTFIEDNICRGKRYTKYGFDVGEAGVYRQKLKGPTGKDSLVVLSLSAIDPVYTYLKGSIYACERYTENGFNVNTAGKHYITRTSAQGCDSIVELDLEVKKQKEQYIYASICSGEVYDQNGFKESDKGVYTQRLKTALGCDSIVTLNLDVTSTIDITVTGKTDLCKGDETVLTASGGNYYKWYDASGNEIGEGETLTVNPSASTTYKVVSSSEQKCPSSVADCQGHTYRVVRIGEQCWMAENMRCDKYDTESEAAGKTISVSEYAYYDPYFYHSNCQDSKCIDRTCTVSYNINDKLGLLYNWAAAVGASEREIYADSDEFSYPRQGICPNGWHVPTLFDYVNLVFNINPDGGEDAKLLKSKEGWCNTGKYDQGLDTYGFTLYPAGEVTRDGHYETVSNVGNLGTLWVVDGAHGELATYCIAYTYDPSMYYNEDGRKYEAHSVRCVKN